MKKIAFIFFLIASVLGCNSKQASTEKNKLPILGTWKLLSGTLIERGDTVITDYTKAVSFIKINNHSHFSFLKHDLNKGKNSQPVFEAGGGTYSLIDSTYTENLDYCSAREWEGNSFTFSIAIHNDTLIQKGIEKIEKSGIDRLNIEKYIRIK